MYPGESKREWLSIVPSGHTGNMNMSVATNMHLASMGATGQIADIRVTVKQHTSMSVPVSALKSAGKGVGSNTGTGTRAGAVAGVAVTTHVIQQLFGPLRETEDVNATANATATGTGTGKDAVPCCVSVVAVKWNGCSIDTMNGDLKLPLQHSPLAGTSTAQSPAQSQPQTQTQAGLQLQLCWQHNPSLIGVYIDVEVFGWDDTVVSYSNAVQHIDDGTGTGIGIGIGAGTGTAHASKRRKES